MTGVGHWGITCVLQTQFSSSVRVNSHLEERQNHLNLKAIQSFQLGFTGLQVHVLLETRSCPKSSSYHPDMTEILLKRMLHCQVSPPSTKFHKDHFVLSYQGVDLDYSLTSCLYYILSRGHHNMEMYLREAIHSSRKMCIGTVWPPLLQKANVQLFCIPY